MACKLSESDRVLSVHVANCPSTSGSMRCLYCRCPKWNFPHFLVPRDMHPAQNCTPHSCVDTGCVSGTERVGFQAVTAVTYEHYYFLGCDAV